MVSLRDAINKQLNCFFPVVLSPGPDAVWIGGVVALEPIGGEYIEVKKVNIAVGDTGRSGKVHGENRAWFAVGIFAIAAVEPV